MYIITRCNGHKIECDIRELSVAGSKRRQMGVVLQVADQGVLVIGVHVGDDALFRGCVFVLVRHRKACSKRYSGGVIGGLGDVARDQCDARWVV